MSREPIKISRDDLMSEVVEGRLREQSTVRSTKDHYERAQVVAPQIAVAEGWRAWLLKSIVYLALFGLLGGVTGGVAGEMLADRPDRAEEAAQLMADLKRIDRAEEVGRYNADDARQARTRVREIGQRNPLFVRADREAHGEAAQVEAPDERSARAVAEMERASAARNDLLIYASAGLLIALALTTADRVIERDIPGLIIHGGIGAFVGMAAGMTVAKLQPTVNGAFGAGSADASLIARALAAAATLGLLGALLGVSTGIIMRNGRRAVAGAFGGLVGGVTGAVIALALMRLSLPLGIAFTLALAITGAAVGLAMGWFEEAAKQGWLRVASGLIAGKQFILYRNPTFVGSAPMSHIYLFRDPQVGRRHAAIFQMPHGYEIENLPLGGPTLVNGHPVTRARLRRGDKIAIGRTTLVFDEKVPS